jgi:hypothetical protein
MLAWSDPIIINFNRHSSMLKNSSLNSRLYLVYSLRSIKHPFRDSSYSRGVHQARVGSTRPKAGIGDCLKPAI